MSYKLKQDSIDVFSSEVSREICDDYFQQTETIDGNGLMSLTGSKQTNLLLVMSLFGKWETETSKLESPYFDFKNETVQEALQAFMKVLSKYIQMDRETLEPLLKGAIHDSVLLHFAPDKYFAETILSTYNGDVQMSSLKDLKKYVKVNEEPFFSVLDEFNGDSVSVSELSGSLRLVYQEGNFLGAEPESFLGELGAGARLEELFEVEEEIPEPVEQEEPVAEVVEEPVESEEASVNAKFNKTKKTVADNLKQKVVKDINSSLSLNERIMFINNLFDGNKDEFQNALHDLETSSDFDDAKSKAQTKYGSGWDLEAEETEAFFEVLERRFA